MGGLSNPIYGMDREMELVRASDACLEGEVIDAAGHQVGKGQTYSD